MIYPYVSSLFGDEFVIVLYAWFLRIIRAICAPTRYRPDLSSTCFRMIGCGQYVPTDRSNRSVGDGRSDDTDSSELDAD